MFKKFLLLLSVLLLFSFNGCTGTKQIDKASIIETVTVSQSEDILEYTFFLLADAEKVESISVKADSFENACNLAKEKYITDMVIDKLELFLIDEQIYDKTFLNDIEYISKQSDISPLMYISLCDKDTFEKIKKEKELSEQIRSHIDNLKKKENKVNINSLSLFNSINSVKHSEINVSKISCKDKIVANLIKIKV